jgi:hypothetical protein
MPEAARDEPWIAAPHADDARRGGAHAGGDAVPRRPAVGRREPGPRDVARWDGIVAAGGDDESFGTLLARVRTASGRSQLRLAEMLCAASGLPTLTRHEVYRWERELRLPSRHWLGWLAVVLDVPLPELERAVAVARSRRAALEAARARSDDTLADRIAELRRLDDLIGGADLAVMVTAELRAALRERAADRRPTGHRRLRLLAELAQLTAWVSADAGAAVTARAAHRLGLRAARDADDRPLAGHLLATAAHLTTDPRTATALAAAAADEVTGTGSATTRALIWHRVAFAAARAGERTQCERALAAADAAWARRDPDHDPPWLYWLDDAERAAMTGRCFAALGRPRQAVPLLHRALGDIRHPRAVALYAGWLAHAHLAAGDPEPAADAAGRALLAAVRAGSVRASTRATAVHRQLLELRSRGARRYARLAAGALPYLPTRHPDADPADPAATWRSTGPALAARDGPASVNP